jgi:mannosylglycerate hydrolase
VVQTELGITEREPARELYATDVLILPTTHDDFAWITAHAQELGNVQKILTNVVERIDANPQLRFSIESTWMLHNFMSLPGQDRAIAQKLLEQISDGQVEVSSQYGLLDERLAREEGVVFNTLVGRRVLMGNYGVIGSNTGFSNDIFGHPGQTPQIMSSLGIDNRVMTRGDTPEASESVVNIWRDPGGNAEILQIRQLGGYGSGDRLGHDFMATGNSPYREMPLFDADERDARAAETVRRYDQNYRDQYERAGLPTYVLFNGADFQPMQGDIEYVTDGLNDTFPETNFALATFGDFVDTVRQLPKENLPRISGELFGAGAYDIRGVDQTHIPTIKVPNARLYQSLLLAEKFNAFARLLYPKSPDQRPYMTDAWVKYLLANTHDSASGSITDEALGELIGMISEGRLKTRRSIKSSIARLATGGELDARFNSFELVDMQQEGEFGIVNPGHRVRSELVFIPVRNEDTDKSPVVVLSDGTRSAGQIIEQDGKRYVGALVNVEGYSSLEASIEWEDKEVEKSPEGFIENEFLRVEQGADGIFFTSKDGEEVKISFDIFRDAGDTYTVQALDHAPISFTPEDFRVINNGPVYSEIEFDSSVSVPRELVDLNDLSDEVAEIRLTTRVRLVKGKDRADISVAIDNPAVKDYVIRAVMKGHNPDVTVRRKDSFMVATEKAEDKSERAWQDRLSWHQFSDGVVNLGSANLFSEGLYAYYAEQEGEDTNVALVLQRGIGLLSRDEGELSNRRHRAAAVWTTPEAQVLGSHEYKLGFSFGEKTDNALVNDLGDFSESLMVTPKGINLTGLPRVSGDVVVVLVKETEDKDGIIYHIANYGGQAEEVDFDRDVIQTNLAEKEIGETVSSFVLNPYAILAVRVPKGS